MSKPTYRAVKFDVYPSGYDEFVESGIRGVWDSMQWVVEVVDKGKGWAVMWRGCCLSKKTGEWVYEPMPSSRTKKFFNEFRFSDFDEALHRAMTVVDKNTLMRGMTFAKWVEYCYNTEEK